MRREAFGATAAGEPVGLWRLFNAAGAEAAFSELGASLVRLYAPDAEGQLADVTLGFTGAEAYAANGLYCGAIIGRYANRIGEARFALDGAVHALSENSPSVCLHGGSPGFHQRLWRAEPGASPGGGLRFTLFSPAGEAGFPGAVTATADYSWSDDLVLRLDLTATTDAPTPLSLAPHPYWNLSGHGHPSILSHELWIGASSFTPVNSRMIPTGHIAPLPQALDFTTLKPLGAHIDAPEPQLRLARGYDHNFVLTGQGLRLAATLQDPESGRRMRLFTNRPALQLYSLNTLSSADGAKDQALYRPRCAVALEPQAFPDAPNQPRFPNAILRPGETFRATTLFHFDAITTKT